MPFITTSTLGHWPTNAKLVLVLSASLVSPATWTSAAGVTRLKAAGTQNGFDNSGQYGLLVHSDGKWAYLQHPN